MQVKTNVCLKLMATFPGQEGSANGGFHATRDHSNVTSVFQYTKKYCVDPAFQKKGVEC
jgi:hypothetical protein